MKRRFVYFRGCHLTAFFALILKVVVDILVYIISLLCYSFIDRVMYMSNRLYGDNSLDIVLLLFIL